MKTIIAILAALAAASSAAALPARQDDPSQLVSINTASYVSLTHRGVHNSNCTWIQAR